MSLKVERVWHDKTDGNDYMIIIVKGYEGEMGSKVKYRIKINCEVLGCE